MVDKNNNSIKYQITYYIYRTYFLSVQPSNYNILLMYFIFNIYTPMAFACNEA